MARIAVFAFGSRGDVEPYVALGLRLEGRGHDVTVAAPGDFEDFVRASGLTFASLGPNISQLLDAPDTKAALRFNPLAVWRIWQDHGLPMVRAALEAVARVGLEADCLIHHPKVLGVADVAEITDAPVVCASPVPFFPTSDFPMIVTARSFGAALNRATWAPLRMSRWAYRSALGPWRRALGLRDRWIPRPGTDPIYGADLRLVGVSPHVLPQPADWDDRTRMTGYWRRPLDEFEPPSQLAAFLESGRPRVYAGFGSMPVDDGDRTAAVLVDAARAVGVRLVLSSGWAGLAATEADDVHVIGDVPHDWLFPRMAAVLHHGGAGTTGAGLLAGRPSLVCPVGVDQPFWGARVAALGCGPPPLPLRRMTVGALADRLHDLTQTAAYADAAGALSAKLRAEDGTGQAADAIEALLARAGPAR